MATFRFMILALVAAFAPLAAQSQSVGVAKPHPVVATTADVASLCRAIGGERVAVSCLVPGPQDPHYLDP
ncbi:MAG: manganese transporter, partial [Planctomycetes bacterium]|nr:manganese transporter [Planctomycetota bacterium]